MLDKFDSIIEQKILEAQRKGEFDNLPGMGQPLHFEDESDIPPEARMAYRILKNAGVIPEDLQLRKELSELKALIEEVPEDQVDRRKQLLARFDEGQSRYFAALERKRPH